MELEKDSLICWGNTALSALENWVGIINSSTLKSAAAAAAAVDKGEEFFLDKWIIVQSTFLVCT